MIVSFGHKGLARLFQTGDTRGIPGHLMKRLKTRLDALHQARKLADLGTPGFRLHPLTDDRAGRWSIWINGLWRLTFTFDEAAGDASDVDLEQYH